MDQELHDELDRLEALCNSLGIPALQLSHKVPVFWVVPAYYYFRCIIVADDVT